MIQSHAPREAAEQPDVQVAGKDGRIVIMFARPTDRVELTGEQAFELAKRLIRSARDVGGISILLPRKQAGDTN